MAADGGDAERTLAAFGAAGIGQAALAAQLQEEGAAAFAKSWSALLGALDTKRAALRKGTA